MDYGKMFSQETRDEIMRLHGEGLGGSAIAQKLGLKIGSVNQVIRNKGVVKDPWTISEEKKAAIISAYRAGTKVYHLEKQFKVSRLRLIQKLQEWGEVKAAPGRETSPFVTMLTEEQVQELLRMDAEGMKIKDIAKHFGISSTAVYNHRLKAGKPPSDKINREYAHDASVLKPACTEGAAWLLGFLLTDGCVHKRTMQWTLHSKDEVALEHLKEILKCDAPIRRRPCVTATGKKTCHSTLSIHGADLVEAARVYGVVPRKSLIAEPWRECPEELLPHYVRGLIDGDGSILLRNRYPIVGLVGSEQVVSWWAELMRSRFGADANAKKIKNIYGARFSKVATTQSVLRWLYKDAKYYLPRKKAVADKILELDVPKEFNDWEQVPDEVFLNLYEKHGNWAKVERELGMPAGSSAAIRLCRLKGKYTPSAAQVARKTMPEIHAAIPDSVILDTYERLQNWSAVARELGISICGLKRIRNTRLAGQYKRSRMQGAKHPRKPK